MSVESVMQEPEDVCEIMIIELFNIFKNKKFLNEVKSQINVLREEIEIVTKEDEEEITIEAKR